MAKLYFRYGAMNSGKSTALMQVAHNYEEQGMRVLILKPQHGRGMWGPPAWWTITAPCAMPARAWRRQMLRQSCVSLRKRSP